MSPVIFKKNDRCRIKNEMLANGFNSIKEKGLKKTAIIDIAKQSGLAKGTFYNFFPSKEQFVISIIEYRNAQIMENIKKFCSSRNFVTRKEVYELVEFVFSDVNENIYTYLTFEEIRQIISKQADFVAPDELAKKTIDYLLSFVPNHKTNCNWKVLVNYSRMLSVIKNFNDTNSFYVEVLDKNISAIFNLIVDEII